MVGGIKPGSQQAGEVKGEARETLAAGPVLDWGGVHFLTPTLKSEV